MPRRLILLHKNGVQVTSSNQLNWSLAIAEQLHATDLQYPMGILIN